MVDELIFAENVMYMVVVRFVVPRLCYFIYRLITLTLVLLTLADSKYMTTMRVVLL